MMKGVSLLTRGVWYVGTGTLISFLDTLHVWINFMEVEI